MRRQVLGWVAAFNVAALIAVTPAWHAAASPRSGLGTTCPAPPCLNADGDGWTGEDERGSPPTSGSGGAAPVVPVGVGRELPAVITQRRLVPACTGNSPDGADALCLAAVGSCPVEGDLAYWVFTRRFNTVTGEGESAWDRVEAPPSICLGPDDPAIDPAVALPALVEREFKRVVVLKGVAEVSPEPETLVNIPTLFTTSSPETYDIPLTLLGQSVVITAKAQRWTWHFGDGATASSTASGTQGRVEHEYRATGSRDAYVVIEWSGTFSVNGGPSRPILGTAMTTGDPARVEVRQARSELVDSSS